MQMWVHTVCYIQSHSTIHVHTHTCLQRTGDVPPPHMVVIPPGWYSPVDKNFNDPKHITKDKLLPKGYGFCRCEEYHLGKILVDLSTWTCTCTMTHINLMHIHVHVHCTCYMFMHTNSSCQIGTWKSEYTCTIQKEYVCGSDPSAVCSSWTLNMHIYTYIEKSKQRCPLGQKQHPDNYMYMYINHECRMCIEGRQVLHCIPYWYPLGSEEGCSRSHWLATAKERLWGTQCTIHMYLHTCIQSCTPSIHVVIMNTHGTSNLVVN